LTDQEHSERTTGGLVGKLAGKAKEATGSLVGNNNLAREGRLQQAQVEAETEADRVAAEATQSAEEAALGQQKRETALERQRLQNEAAAHERDQQIERDRQAAEVEARAEAERKQAEAERQRSVEASAANSATGRAEHDRLAAAKDEIRLEQQAREAEARAIAIDPKENQ
jgi:uncharacterized protein YjbJ (UPF0337 family)